jgi:acyl-CoA reductase-like NAD-dependent aldehyde dehydrogenase
VDPRLLIDGVRVGGDGPPLQVENPFTEETAASVALPSPEQIDAAIAAARRAATAWASTPALERGEFLHEDFVSAFAEHTGPLCLGDPMSDDVDLGPMASARQREKVAKPAGAPEGNGP